MSPRARKWPPPNWLSPAERALLARARAGEWIVAADPWEGVSLLRLFHRGLLVRRRNGVGAYEYTENEELAQLPLSVPGNGGEGANVVEKEEGAA